jgi:hypothetical protein
MNPCPFCLGEGRYASPLTNWDSVPCDRCDGTGEAPALVRVGEAIARRALAAMDADLDRQATPLLDPERIAYARTLYAGGKVR